MPSKQINSDVSDVPIGHHPISIADQTPSLDGPYVFQILEKPQCKMIERKKYYTKLSESDPT